jgi:hypothetical protein
VNRPGSGEHPPADSQQDALRDLALIGVGAVLVTALVKSIGSGSG